MIVVMSDSHTERAPILEIKRYYPETPIFHCGDSELPARDKIWSNLRVVTGNCDFDADYSDIIAAEVDHKKILMTHGHMQNVAYGLENLSDLAEKNQADIVLFGHIHRPVAEVIGHTLFVNPGSVSQPRGEFKQKMYAVIDWSELTGFTRYHVDYKTLDHQSIPELQFTLEVAKNDFSRGN